MPVLYILYTGFALTQFRIMLNPDATKKTAVQKKTLYPESGGGKKWLM
jgi:hypothetical protein